MFGVPDRFANVSVIMLSINVPLGLPLADRSERIESVYFGVGGVLLCAFECVEEVKVDRKVRSIDDKFPGGIR